MKENRFVMLSDDELLITNGGSSIVYPEPTPSIPPAIGTAIVNGVVDVVETIVNACKK
ncbi:hypothetical protein II906_07895 [bacterium]|nr:hypothetical protein [bacterium]